MNLLKSKLSVAIALGILGGSTHAATIECTITPANSIITEGQTLQLAANCVGGALESIDWRMNYIGDELDAVSVTGVVPLAGHATGQDVYYTTPVGLSSSGTGDFRFTVAGESTGNTVTSTEAQVIVQPTSGTTLAYNPANTSNPVAPIAGVCGTSSGFAVQNMPTGTEQCSAGKSALAISGPTSFTWSCLGLNGGTEANCYALRGNTYTVTASAATGGNISPSSQLVNSNTSTSFTVTPTFGYNIASVTGCSGSLSGSIYTTGAITSACSVAASFAAEQVQVGPDSDPGIGGGLWVPPNVPNRTVADQSGDAAWRVTYAPGCLNGQTAANSSTGCAAQSSFNGFSLGSGRSLVLRYKSTPTAGSSLKYIRTRSYDGGNVGVNMRVWLSTSPTATYETVATACKQTSSRTPMVVTGPGYCPIAPNTVYYYGMDYNETDSLRFQVEETSADFL